MDDPSSSPPDDPTAVPPPEGTPDGVEDYGLTVYDYISIALPGVYWIAYYVVNYLYHKEVRRGMSVSTRAVLPAGGKLEVNQHISHGKNRRSPSDGGAGATAPVVYEGDAVAEMGLVVKLDEAIDHWNKGLYSPWDAYQKTGHARPVRYKVDGTVPYAMISYNSALKNAREECPHGPDAVTQMLQLLKEAGWEYIWWDWLVINDSKGAYKQADFEAAMTWAQTTAYEVAVVWPTPADGLAYLSRPWCLSEILACTSRGAHTIYSFPGKWVSISEIEHSDTLKYLHTLFLFSDTIVTPVVFSMVLFVGMLSGMEEGGDAISLGGAKAGLVIYAFVGIRLVMNYIIGGGRIQSPQFLFPRDVINYMADESNGAKKEHRKSLVSALCEAGHLKGVMWDLGDTMSCGELLGYDNWRFAFEQATLKWREHCNAVNFKGGENKATPWDDQSFGRKVAFDSHPTASWLNGKRCGSGDEHDAVTGSFTGVEMLWFSRSESLLASLYHLISPIVPLQFTKGPVHLDRPFLCGTAAVKVFYCLIAVVTCGVAYALISYKTSIGWVILVSMILLIPHFMMTSGMLTLVSTGKTYMFCSMVVGSQMFVTILMLVQVLSNYNDDTFGDIPTDPAGSGGGDPARRFLQAPEGDVDPASGGGTGVLYNIWNNMPTTAAFLMVLFGGYYLYNIAFFLFFYLFWLFSQCGKDAGYNLTPSRRAIC